jgi:Na+/melibiose symporter-like transporter
MCIAGAAGLGLGGAMLLPWSMLPDVVDADELQTGERREGDFYGLFVMLQKVGLGLALAGSSLALGAAGYVSPETEQGGDHQHTMQPDDVKLVLRLLIGPLPGGYDVYCFVFHARLSSVAMRGTARFGGNCLRGTWRAPPSARRSCCSQIE